MYVVLVSPEHPGNVGAVARVMKNFGFNQLIIVNPACDYLSEEARKRAKHAIDVLENAIILNSIKEIRKHANILIGTTGKGGHEIYRRNAFTPEELASWLKRREDVALVFGRESVGLTNEEILQMDVLSTIPANPEYPILNLSHAVAVYLYEFSKVKRKKGVDKGDFNILIKKLDELSERLEYRDLHTKKYYKYLLRSVIARANLDEKEVRWMVAFLDKLLNKIT